jgi:molecular chaperone GrpE
MKKDEQTLPPEDEEEPLLEGEEEDAEEGESESDVRSATATAPAPDIDILLTEQRDKYLRLAADYDNYRKRAIRDREGAEHHGRSTVVRGLLEALDDLARFAHLDAAKTDAGTVIAGAAMVEQKLLKSLAGHGLEPINPAVGEAFDPKDHEAVSTAPAAAAREDHTIAQVYQVGYRLAGQLLRPARVVVKQWAG